MFSGLSGMDHLLANGVVLLFGCLGGHWDLHIFALPEGEIICDPAEA